MCVRVCVGVSKLVKVPQSKDKKAWVEVNMKVARQVVPMVKPEALSRNVRC